MTHFIPPYQHTAIMSSFPPLSFPPSSVPLSSPSRISRRNLAVPQVLHWYKTPADPLVPCISDHQLECPTPHGPPDNEVDAHDASAPEELEELSESVSGSSSNSHFAEYVQPVNYMTEPDAAYLHLEVACARWSVLQAQMHLASCEHSEHMTHMHLNHLKVQYFKKTLKAANTNISMWCDTILRSGWPLHSWNVSTSPRCMPRCRHAASNFFLGSSHVYIFADYKPDQSHRCDINEEYFVDL